MAYALWGGGVLSSILLLRLIARAAIGFFGPMAAVGPGYLRVQLVRMGVPRNLRAADIRNKIVVDSLRCAAWESGRLAQRAYFRKSLDIAALQYAMWLKDPAARLPGEPYDGKHLNSIRQIFGTPPELSAGVRARILPHVELFRLPPNSTA